MKHSVVVLAPGSMDHPRQARADLAPDAQDNNVPLQPLHRRHDTRRRSAEQLLELFDAQDPIGQRRPFTTRVGHRSVMTR